MDFAAIILAAGQGKRMGTELPKVLVPVAGRPMIEYVLEAISGAEGSDSGFRAVKQIVVVGYQAERVCQSLGGRWKVSFVLQAQQRGTADAVMAAYDRLHDFDGPIVVMAGDQPLTQASTIRRMLTCYQSLSSELSEPLSCLIGTVVTDNPAGMGRIIRNDQGDFLGIVEQKDATSDQQAIHEVNVSYYVFRSSDLWTALNEIRPNNAQGEYYLTDCPSILQRMGKTVRAQILLDPVEALSVNTIAQRDEAERVLLGNRPPNQ